MKKLTYCKKCLMPTTRPRVTFDAKGICNACHWAEQKKTFDWTPRWQKLEALCDKYRSKSNDKFDVIVPYSGGKDGGYIAWMLREKLGMTPLVVTKRPPMEDPIGEQNIKNFLDRGFDHLIITPNRQIARYIDKDNFISRGLPMQAHLIAMQASVFRAAVQFNIPFVMFAEEGESEYGGSTALLNQHTYSVKESIDFYLSGVNPEKYLNNFSRKQLYWFTFPSEESLLQLNPEISHWSFFEDFDGHLHYTVAKEHLGLLEKKDRNPGSYENYSTTDTYIIWLYFYLMYLKFGFGRTSHLASDDIRRGKITREQGIDLVRKFDGEYPEQHVSTYLEYFSMSKEEFDATVDKWANKDLFEKVNGRWRPLFELY